MISPHMQFIVDGSTNRSSHANFPVCAAIWKKYLNMKTILLVYKKILAKMCFCTYVLQIYEKTCLITMSSHHIESYG
jgi:hypothetical protein